MSARDEREKRRGPMHFSPDGGEANGAREGQAKVSEGKDEKLRKPHARAPKALPADEATVVEPQFSTPGTEGAEEATVMDEAIAEPGIGRVRRWPVRLLMWAGSLLLTLTLALVLDLLVRAAFERADWLGFAALALVGLAALAAFAVLLRELFGLLRLRRVLKLRRLAERVADAPDERGVAELRARLEGLYARRADMRWALERLRAHEAAVLSPPERLRLLELELMGPLDAQARRILLRSARDVAALTAIVPSPALDVLIVGLRNVRMLRQLAALYGGRPGLLGGWRLLRMVLAHLALTGALALSDAFLPHVLGKGLAGRLSARFGEGVLNGVLTARIGLAALEQVRPMPFVAAEKPGLKELAAALVKG